MLSVRFHGTASSDSERLDRGHERPVLEAARQSGYDMRI